MKKRIFSLILCLIIFVSCFGGVITAGAADSKTAGTTEEIEIVFLDLVSKEFENKINNFFIYGQPNFAPMGLTCTLFGHKTESGAVEITKHKVRTTAPRCLMELYEIVACQRSGCDYLDYWVLGSYYVFCC